VKVKPYQYYQHTNYVCLDIKLPVVDPLSASDGKNELILATSHLPYHFTRR